MKPTEFDRLSSRTRLRDRGLTMARAVLVDGRSQSEVAAEHGVHRQSVHQSCRAVLNQRRYKSNRKRPKSWVSVTVVVPHALAREIRQLARAAMAERAALAAGRKAAAGKRPEEPQERPQEAPDVTGAAEIARTLLARLSVTPAPTAGD